MKTYLSNCFNDIIYDDQTSTLYHIMKPGTVEMKEEEFKEMLISWKQIALDTHAKFLLVDTQEMVFPVSPELQLWVTQQITVPVTQEGVVDKLGFVMPEEFISQLSMSQLIKEEDQKVGHQTQIRYFGNQIEAKNWLI